MSLKISEKECLFIFLMFAGKVVGVTKQRKGKDIRLKFDNENRSLYSPSLPSDAFTGMEFDKTYKLKELRL